MIKREKPEFGRMHVQIASVCILNNGFDSRWRYENSARYFRLLLDCAVWNRFAAMGELYWIDQYSGKAYRICGSEPYGSRNMAHVSHGDVLLGNEFDPEVKYADHTGKSCSKRKRQPFRYLGRHHAGRWCSCRTVARVRMCSAPPTSRASCMIARDSSGA